MKKGLVVKTTGSWHLVKSGDDLVQCKLRGSFREKNIRNTNPIAVGDNVSFETTDKETGIINSIDDRDNYIIRKATNLSKETHILAANVDQLLLMVTVKHPVTPLEFIDRFLMSAEAYHIKTILLINKMDLYKEKELERVSEITGIYQFAGYPCYQISLQNESNIKILEQLLKDKKSILAGNSGVGKSTMINMLCPGISLKTSPISNYHLSGKHTTTYAEMLFLPFGGYIIDTPGIKGFGIIDIDKNEIALYFTDIFKISKNCRFYNCTHHHEPGCAVMDAVKSGILSESRYRSYLNIFLDNQQKYRTGLG